MKMALKYAFKKARASLLVGTALALSLTLAVPDSAQATTVRPGAKAGQVDVLLDSYETEQARRSLWGATVICWNSGIGGKVLSLGVCQSAVSVCAAQAYYASPRRKAGMTFTPWGQFWCWKY
ncbi:hypothetical protein ABZT34_26835 [Streptomyces sp. NPDC005329]|uniref:hypothetical protein n=1 Tax=Streptomyces sp. NPDC005329 TaxID=3157034 RepID=UPI0033B45C6D